MNGDDMDRLHCEFIVDAKPESNLLWIVLVCLFIDVFLFVIFQNLLTSQIISDTIITELVVGVLYSIINDE